MTLRVLFFARLKEQLHTDKLELDVGDAILSVSELRKRLLVMFDNHEALQVTRTLVAVNQQMANEETQVTAGDEVAFFPPVTGG